MHDDVAMSTAAKELGLEPGEMALAAQLGHVRTVRAEDSATTLRVGRGPVRRRVPRDELARLRAAEDFPNGLRERLRVVDAGGGAELLGVTGARFARLARGGCFSPVRFYLNRYRTVVWLYLAQELNSFAENRPELLSGILPRGLRMLLAEGVDLRAGHWRGRRVGQLCRQAEGPWEAAAARAAVLSEEILREAVPDEGERARLSALRPELVPFRGRPPAVREVAEELCKAAAEDEIFWQRLMLAADLESARASEARAPEDAAELAHSAGPAHGAGPSDSTDGKASWPAGRTQTCTWRPPARTGLGPPPDRGARTGVAGSHSHGRSRPVEQRARVLNALRAPRQRPPWWGSALGPERPRGFSRPAF
ncbi:hypothetical protein G4Z16_00320 [Streptomyces bathyalis]|uniref:Uncharacterized protein n=1 Tax=Streptomyces bathyalis TaxID=2710756 RepID=A0A7T1T2B9_9ACTN|nr:DUF6397 family protein [Streptomyces bathyalis]QPP05089.1 hypothetical protein G4Z16_00320 [Streptomyces bathyalis]